jgi:hypothetical protein
MQEVKSKESPVHASGANQNYLHQSTVALWRMQSDQREHGQLRRYME